MAKKKNRKGKEQSAKSRVRQNTGATRKTSGRKVRAPARVQAKVKSQAVKTTPKSQPQQKSASANRSEGVQQYKRAGRPTREQFQLVYGRQGHLMTWKQRVAAGIPAEKFQAALAAKVAEKAVSRPAAAKPAPTTKQTPTLPLAGA
jgi:hypothetical protein